MSSLRNFDIRDFFKKISIDKRYWLIFLLLITFLFIGKKFDPNLISIDPASQRSLLGTDYQIYEVNRAYSPSLNFSSLEDEDYRLDFEILASPVLENENREEKKKENEYVSIVVYLKSAVGRVKELDTLMLATDSKSLKRTYQFETDNTYDSIVFEKKYESDQARVNVYNVNIARVSDTGHKFYVNGNSRLNQNVTANIPAGEATVPVNLTKKNQSVGAIFRAESDFLGGVELRLKILGRGGKGSYRLNIQEVDSSGEGYSFKPGEAISEVFFNATDAEKTYVTKAKDDLYYFPLPAKLEKGKYYFVGIENTDVETSRANCLQLYSSKQGGEGFIINKSGSSKRIGQIYLGIESVENLKLKDEKVLFGGLFQEIGNGEAKFRYSLDRSPLTPLDGNYYGDSWLEYQFNTILPFKRAQLSFMVNSIIPEQMVFEYSLDGKKWYLIKKENSEATYEQSIRGNGLDHIIYLRAASRPDEMTGRIVLNRLNVDADLEVK